MKNDNPNHQLRFSIDIKTLKQHDFTAQLSLRYLPCAELGLPSFRSASVSIHNPRVEVPLRDCFQSGYFQASAIDMQSKLDQKIQIQLWHCDRLKKDVFLGKSILEVNKILQMPLRTTNQSYARVLDAYLPVDQYNEQGKPVKSIGCLRVVAYLQDLGSVQKLQQKGFNVKDYLQEPQENVEAPSQKLQNQQQQLFMQSAGLNQLQRKVVWQLQTWKKAQEAKTRITLKNKQLQFWTNLSQQQRKSDLEKQKQFKKIQANLLLQENKLKTKMSELIKRQQKIVLLQKQLESKIDQVSKDLRIKDQQIQSIKKRHKQDRTSVVKQKAQVQVQLAKTRAECAKLKVQLEEARKQDDKSPFNILKAQLNARILQIKQLSKQVQAANEVKQQYKIYYGKMREEVINLKQQLKLTQQSVHELRRQKQILINNCKHAEQQLAYQRQMHQQHFQRATNHHKYESEEDPWQNQQQYMSQKQKLIKQRQKLIRQNYYPINDPLILQLDRQIRTMQ